MRTMTVALIVFIALCPPIADARTFAKPEEVIRQYAAAWNAGDLETFLALHSPDVRKHRRVDERFELTTQGREVVREKYQPLFAKTPRVRVEIVALLAQGNIVVCRDRVSRADGPVSHELTMYEVRDGLIQNIWYLDRGE
jgi:hypothetical protein